VIASPLAAVLVAARQQIRFSEHGRRAFSGRPDKKGIPKLDRQVGWELE
jgi:hypothetical protein